MACWAVTAYSSNAMSIWEGFACFPCLNEPAGRGDQDSATLSGSRIEGS
jgi:hypothetical protein